MKTLLLDQPFHPNTEGKTNGFAITHQYPLHVKNE